MNIIATTTLRNNLADTLKQVNQSKYLLISKRGRINSALINIDLLEDLLALANPKYIQSIKKSRQEYETGQTLSHQQIFGQL